MGVHLEELPLVHPATGKRTIGSGLSQTIEVCGMAPIGGISLSPSACQNLTAPYLQNALQFRGKSIEDSLFFKMTKNESFVSSPSQNAICLSIGYQASSTV